MKTTLTIAALLLAGPAIAADHKVTIRGMAFEPVNLSISVGDTVTFINADGAPHTATANGDVFDTGRLNKNKAARVSFDQAGSFDYFCRFHRGMTGQIAVN